MKHLCMIADSFDTHALLTPLMASMDQDPCLDLSIILMDHHKAQGVEIWYGSAQGCGPAIEETQTLFPSHGEKKSFIDFEKDFLSRSLERMGPDMVLVFGASPAAFRAAVASFLLNIPVAHIQGGESDYRQWEESPGLGITKISEIHFTATETGRRRVLGFGEHPDRVFDVGALAACRIRQDTLGDRNAVCQDLGLDPDKEFLFVSMVPDRMLGSRNEALMASVTTALAHPGLEDLELVMEDPGERGFARIMKRQVRAWAGDMGKTICFIRDDPGIINAMAHARAILGNSDRCPMDAALVRTPVVSIGDRLARRENPGHMVQAAMDPQAVLTGLARAMDPGFKAGLNFLDLPFERPNTLTRIREILKAYTPSDLRHKSHFNH